MIRIFLAIFTGLVGAALLHIFIILVLPLYTGTDIWSKTERLDKMFEFHLLPDATSQAEIYNPDANIQTAICQFDISEGALQIFADDPANLWTLAIFGNDGSEVFSMSARSAIDGKVDFLVLTAAQLLVLKSDEPELTAETISVQMRETEGFAVLRYIAPSDSEIAIAQEFLKNAQCVPL